MTSILDSMPVRVAATGPLARHLRALPADVYRSGLASGLAHVRLTLDAPGPAALVAEAVKLAVTTRPDWPAAAAHTGVGVGTKVLAGSPTLSLTVAADRLDSTLGFLRATADRLTWADLAQATTSVEQDARARQERQNPRTTARRLAAGPEPERRSEATEATGRLPVHLTLLAHVAGTVEPARVLEVLPVEHPESVGAGAVHRSGSGKQTWYAVGWELRPVDAERAAAAELFLFALAGAPFSPLFQALRDELGISYGPRTSVQRRRGSARAWLDLAFPTAHEARVRSTIEQIFGAADDEIRRWMARSRTVLLSSVLGAFDFGSGQADALALGRVVGSPTYPWDVAAHLVDGDLSRLLDRVPTRLRMLSAARVGSYQA